MSYYTGQGDYYSGKGDPGLFSFLGKAVGTVARVGTSMLPGPVGAIGRTFTSKLPSFAPKAPVGPAVPRISLPTTTRGYSPGKPVATTPMGMPYFVKKRGRRMNYGNVKALRRADRRIDGFVGVARKALKHTNYKVVSRSAGSRSGSRGVITRSEAAKALRA